MEGSATTHDMNLASRKAEEAGLFLLLSFIALSLANEKNEEQKKIKNRNIRSLFWLFGVQLKKTQYIKDFKVFVSFPQIFPVTKDGKELKEKLRATIGGF